MNIFDSFMIIAFYTETYFKNLLPLNDAFITRKIIANFSTYISLTYVYVCNVVQKKKKKLHNHTKLIKFDKLTCVHYNIGKCKKKCITKMQ